MRIIAALIFVLTLFSSPASAKNPAVVVIGIDGLDPVLLQQFVDRGLMPNFASMIDNGSFVPLGTSIPPQSPVAWSNFITGMDPGGHGIFDFIHRDPSNYTPIFSTALVSDPEKTLSLGDWIIPLSAGETELLRRGEAFWQILDRHDIPATVFRVPANFPPAETKSTTISGMGTPDILGTYGTFSFFTDDDIFDDIEVSGGEIYKVAVDNGQVKANLIGPQNTLRKDRQVMTRAFTVDVDPEHDAVRVTIDDDAFLLEVGEWSDWQTVDFDIVGPLKGITGICKFYVKSVRPYFRLYVTPINIDPANPALPISTPEGYAHELYEKIGRFYTQGMAEDTKALEHGIFEDGEFVSQTDIVLDERWKMLDAVLDDYEDGFLFFYVSTIDLSCHMLWRNVDEKHPAHTEFLSFEDRFEQLYANMDSLLGVVSERIPDDATLIVMSDHGFAPYYKKFHLNTWLHDEGYLSLIREGEIGQHSLLDNVFWRRTKAYALGINGLYVNVLGREAKGIIREGKQYNELLDDITRKLLAVRDPETGEQVITRVYRGSETYTGDAVVDGPDLIVGYNRGYRGSDESALGTLTTSALTPNMGKWTGDHCIDHTLVPGVLVSNRPVTVADPTLIDLPVTILNFYGIAVPKQMRGRVVMAP